MWAPHRTLHNDCHQCVNWSATGSCVWKWKWQTVVPTARWEDIPRARASLLSPVVWYCDSSLRFSLRPFPVLWSYFLPGILCTQSPMMSVCLSTCYGNGRNKARNTILFITHGMDMGSGVWQTQTNSYFCGKSPHAPGGASQPESFPHLKRPGSLHFPSALRFRVAIIITLFLCNTSVYQTFSQILLFE